MIGAVARFFALARTKLARGPSSPPTLTIDRLADWYREQHAAAPEDAAVLETAVQLAVMCDRVDEARAMLGDRGPELGLRVVGEALIDPERAAREEGAYVAVLNDVLVETHDWTILDGDKIYNREAHARSLYKCPWVGNRTTPDRKQYLFKVLPPALTIDEPCIHLGSDANYAHWVERNLLKLALLEGSEYESLPLLLRAPVLPHQREFLDVMGIPDTRLVLAPAGAFVRCRTLVVPTSLVYSPRLALGVEWLRRKLAAWMDPGPPRELVYLSRGEVSVRRVVNEPEVQKALAALGFRILVPGRMSVQEQVRAVSAARVIVGPHGATFANLVFAPKGATVLELNSLAKSHVKDFTLLAKALGLKHEILLTVDYDPPQQGSVPRDTDYRVDTAEVLATLKDLEPQLFA